MQNDAATLYCPNDLCQAPNPQTHKFCQQCRTPMIKRYLWAVGEGVENYQSGTLLADRYLLKSNRIFLDTKPGLLPETPDLGISETMKPYLKLVAYRLQVPQVYGLVSLGEGQATEILLLEQAPIYTEAMPSEGQLMSELTAAWKNATSMRQLNWLWQIAQLWQPLSSEGVASSLLEPALLRVEGSLLQLLELHLDRDAVVTLSQLGQMWLQLLVPGAKLAIAEFLQQLCHSLIQGEVRSAEQLVAVLDRGLTEIGRSQTCTLKLATFTDTGPSRQRNEDACYPPSGTNITLSPNPEALAIVCDGIGGHEGGNVASNLAIETIQQQVRQLIELPTDHLDPITLSADLERFACAANDRISQRNDSEHRHGRQRMGTTLVMALPVAHEFYITHVGDSRAYWITRSGCRQVTLDDDVASREVRLGYALYRNALQQASSGSLVQALGMSPSVSLHPTVQRFILNEDCILLLCSDGLSDYDRVEQCWETEILPIVDGKVDVATAGARLVEIANTQNGHDNVTVALIYCHVGFAEPSSAINPSLAQQITPQDAISAEARTTLVDASAPEPTNTAPSTLKTQFIPAQRSSHAALPVLLGLILLLSLGSAVLAYLYVPAVKSRINPLLGSNPSPSSPQPNNSSPPTAPASSPVSANLKIGSLIQLKSNRVQTQTVPFLLQHPSDSANTPIGSVPSGALVQVKSVVLQQTALEKGNWLLLKVCPNRGQTARPQPQKTATTANEQTPQRSDRQTPPASNTTPASPNPKGLKSGQEGWILASEITPFIDRAWEPANLGGCPTPAPASTPAALTQEG